MPFDIDPSLGGNVPPREFGVVTAACPVGSVKFVVVSTVLLELVSGGVSPGALIVDDAPVVLPSWTTSYCFCSRWMSPWRWQAAPNARRKAAGTINLAFILRGAVACCMPRLASMNDESAIRATFTKQELMRTLGASLGRVGEGEVEIVLPWRTELGQQAGLLHAGVIASIADSACGFAALTLMEAGADVVSVEFKLNLLAPARGERFAARARVVRGGRTLTVATADVFAITDEGETLVATMLGTMMSRKP